MRPRALPGVALGALLVALLAACRVLGSGVDEEAVESLRPGVHTEADAIAIIGKEPDGQTQFDDGSRVLRWTNAMPDARSLHHDSLALFFDSRGVLTRIDYRSGKDNPRPDGKHGAER